jgi:hypothetical protein
MKPLKREDEPTETAEPLELLILLCRQGLSTAPDVRLLAVARLAM